MTIQQITTEFAGQVGIKPQIIRLVCDDSLSAIMEANYLLSAKSQGYEFSNGDIALITYDSTPITQFFKVQVTSSAITLAPLILSGTTPTYAGGSSSNAFTVTGLTANATGSAVIRTSTNAVSIVKAVPSANTLTITFSGDPGAGTTVDYIYSTN